MKLLATLFLIAYSSFLYASFGEESGPVVRVVQNDKGMKIYTEDAVNILQKNFPGRLIYISSINIVEIGEDQNPGNRWVVINDGLPHCKVKFPHVINYGQALGRCLRVERNDQYKKRVNYMVGIDAYVEDIGSVEFLPVWK